MSNHACSCRSSLLSSLLSSRPSSCVAARLPHVLILVGSLAWLVSASAARADDPKARAIMERVDARDDGDNQTSTLQMILIDKNQKQRVRELRSFSKDKGEDTWSMMFFLAPADVEDTGFLTYDYDEAKRDDDQWLYLPALKKTKRIASSDKSGSFMGSDFSYADMTERPLAYYDFKLLQEAEVDGQPVWVIESVPNNDEELDETGYTKSILFIRKDNDVMIRCEELGQEGQPQQVLRRREARADRRHLGPDGDDDDHEEGRADASQDDPANLRREVRPEARVRSVFDPRSRDRALKSAESLVGAAPRRVASLPCAALAEDEDLDDLMGGFEDDFDESAARTRAAPNRIGAGAFPSASGSSRTSI